MFRIYSIVFAILIMATISLAETVGHYTITDADGYRLQAEPERNWPHNLTLEKGQTFTFVDANFILVEEGEGEPKPYSITLGFANKDDANKLDITLNGEKMILTDKWLLSEEGQQTVLHQYSISTPMNIKLEVKIVAKETVHIIRLDMDVSMY